MDGTTNKFAQVNLIYFYLLKEKGTAEARYIGQTVVPSTRFHQHLADIRNTNKTLWIQTVLANGGQVEMVILEQRYCNNEQEILAIECFWIEHFTLKGHNLTNSNSGGGGCSAGKYKHTDEVKEQIGATHRGKLVSIETGAKIAETKLGEKNPAAKMTTQKVVEMRELYATGRFLCRELATKFGASLSATQAIVSGTSWTKVGGPITRNGYGHRPSILDSL